jgi:small subunit ribosomal protein S8
MAKLSSINKNERRKKLVEEVCGQVRRAQGQADDESLDETERLIARLKMAELPRNATHARPQPLQHHRPPAWLLPQVRPLPRRTARSRQQGAHPRRDEVELVRSLNDGIDRPLGDMLTRIRNGQQAKKDSVLSPASKLRAHVLEVLQREGYIRGFSEDATGAHPQLRIELKYFEGQPAIKHVARVSKPGRRVYSGSRTPGGAQRPWHHHRLDAAGVLSDAEARAANVGGEVLAEVF